MNKYVTGAVIRRLREGRRMTQEDLAERICVSGKAVSKWKPVGAFPMSACLTRWQQQR